MAADFLPPRQAAAASPGPAELRGRAAEVKVLAGLVEPSPVRAERVLVVRGEPGTGKAALLDELATQARDCQVVPLSGPYLRAWATAMFAGHLAGAGDLREVSRAALAAPAPARLIDLLLDGLALMVTDGPAVAPPVLRTAVAAFASAGTPVEERLRWTWLSQVPASYLWDFDRVLAIAAGATQLARDAGALDQLPIDLQAQAQIATWSGDIPAAAALITQARVTAEATGTRIAPLAAMSLAALRGRESEAAPLIEATIRAGTAGGQGIAVSWARWATAILCNGLGRYAAAEAAAGQAGQELPEHFVATFALPELAEAAARTGNGQLAARAVDQLAEATQAGGTDWGLGVEARCRALVSDGQAAEDLYREAIERLRRTRLRPELARAHLLYGEWLRRQNRRTDARQQLRTAHDLLSDIGMEAFAERARRELAATGGNCLQAHRPGHRQGQPGADHPGSSGRPARSRRPVQPRDRRPAVHQRPHRLVPPGQGLRQPRHHLPQPAPSRAARRPGTRASNRQSAGSARVTATALTRQARPPLTIAIRTEPVSDATSPDSRPPDGSPVGTAVYGAAVLGCCTASMTGPAL
jgi:tetratricopeptide (TPR) repeat protein